VSPDANQTPEQLARDQIDKRLKAAGWHVRKKDAMKRQLLEIYALAVCFFTVACFVIVVGMLLWDAVRVAAPGFTVPNHVFEMHQSEQSYRRMQGPRMTRPVPPADPAAGTAPLALSAPEDTLSRDESWALALRAERREGLRGIVRNAIILVIDLLVFGLHWRIARGARAEAG